MGVPTMPSASSAPSASAGPAGPVRGDGERVRLADGTRVTSPAPRDVWAELFRAGAGADADADAMASHDPAWLDLVATAVRGRDASRLYEFEDGSRAVLPLVRRRLGRSPVPMLESMPGGWGYGGPIADRPVTAGMVRAVTDDLAAQRALRVHLRPNPLHTAAWRDGCSPRFTPSPSTTAHVLDLRGGFDVVWHERFTGHARRAVRRAERSGVVVESDTTGRLMPVFHRLLTLSFRRWAQQQHEPAWMAAWRGARRDPLAKWQRTADTMGEAVTVYIAWHRGEAAAGAIVLNGPRTAHYTRAAMDKDAVGPSQAPSLVQKTAIEDACRAGRLSYHMGETGAMNRLAQAKESFGARPHEFCEYRHERVPLTRADRLLRSAVKRAIGYQDV